MKNSDSYVYIPCLCDNKGYNKAYTQLAKETSGCQVLLLKKHEELDE